MLRTSKKGVGQMKRKKAGSLGTLIKIAEIGKEINAKGPKDLSSNLDKYLWDR